MIRIIHKLMLVNVCLRKSVLTFFQPKLDLCDIILYIFDNVKKEREKSKKSFARSRCVLSEDL